MEQIVTTIEKVNGILNNFIWGPYMLIFFLLVGAMFTIRTGFFQITQFRNWIDVTFLNVFRDRKVLRTDDKHSISDRKSVV